MAQDLDYIKAQNSWHFIMFNIFIFYSSFWNEKESRSDLLLNSGWLQNNENLKQTKK